MKTTMQIAKSVNPPITINSLLRKAEEVAVRSTGARKAPVGAGVGRDGLVMLYRPEPRY
jgi:hypothetical protein